MRRWRSISDWYAEFAAVRGWEFLAPMVGLTAWVAEQPFAAPLFPGTSHEWLCVHLHAGYNPDRPFFSCGARGGGQFECELWAAVGRSRGKRVVPFGRAREVFAEFVAQLQGLAAEAPHLTPAAVSDEKVQCPPAAGAGELRRPAAEGVGVRKRRRPLIVLLLAAAAVAGCCLGPWGTTYPPPGPVTRIEVEADRRGDRVRVIDDPAGARRVVEFVDGHRRGWGWPSDWAGVPVPQVSAYFYDGSEFKGHFGVGPGFFECQRAGDFASKHCSGPQERRFLELVGLPGHGLPR